MSPIDPGDGAPAASSAAAIARARLAIAIGCRPPCASTTAGRTGGSIRLDAVGEHDQRRLARLRLGAGVAELALVDRRRGARPVGRLGAAVWLGNEAPGPGEEVAHDRRPVMLRDERDEAFW